LHHNPNSTYWYFWDYLLQEEVKEEEYNEEDLYAKAEQEFYKIIEEEKKLQYFSYIVASSFIGRITRVPRKKHRPVTSH
jgi:hypothetical protein